MTRVAAEPLWSHQQTADYLAISPWSLYSMNSRGTGPRSFKVGRVRRYDPADVRRWLASRANDQSKDGSAS